MSPNDKAEVATMASRTAFAVGLIGVGIVTHGNVWALLLAWVASIHFTWTEK